MTLACILTDDHVSPAYFMQCICPSKKSLILLKVWYLYSFVIIVYERRVTNRIERFGEMQSEQTDIDNRQQHCQHCVDGRNECSGCRVSLSESKLVVEI